MAEYHFAIRCPSCESTLRLTNADLGTKRACPKCRTILQVPAKVAANDQAAAEEAKHEFSFLCKLCSTRLYGRPSQVGQGISCPDCQTLNTVPPPAKRRKKQVPADLGDEYQLAPAEDRPPPSSPGMVDEPSTEVQQVRFTCRYCNSMLYAPVDRVGKHVECPDCSGQVVVPKPARERPKTRVTLDDAPDVSFSPVAERPQEASNAESLMSSAMDHVIERERDRPDPPKHPFGPNVYGFPFTPTVIALGVVLFGLYGLTNYLMLIGIESQGKEMVIGMLVWMTGIFCFAASGIWTSFVATNIVTWAAMGYQKVVEWPRFDILDWLRRSLFLFNAFAVSSAPGAAIAYFLPGGTWRVIFPVASTFFLFPIVMLSMVSEESPFVPLSGFILSSLGRVTGSWIKFFAHAAVLSGLVTVPVIASLFSSTWTYVAVAVWVYGILVYFRVLGRLAYVIDEGLAGYDDTDVNEDEGILVEETEDRGVEPPPVA